MATTVHFGPEWMRTKHQLPSRSQPPPSPPPLASAPVLGASTYSALVSPAPPLHPEKRDEAHPFRYSKEEMLRIYKEGGRKGGLGLEVERWEGVVREVGSEPVGLREMGDAEKKVRTDTSIPLSRFREVLTASSAAFCKPSQFRSPSPSVYRLSFSSICADSQH